MQGGVTCLTNRRSLTLVVLSVPAESRHAYPLHVKLGYSHSKVQGSRVFRRQWVTKGLCMQDSVAREVPESPRQAKAKAKDNKKGRDGGMPAAAARTPQTSEYAEQLKKVTCP